MCVRGSQLPLREIRVELANDNFGKRKLWLQGDSCFPKIRKLLERSIFGYQQIDRHITSRGDCGQRGKHSKVVNVNLGSDFSVTKY